MTFEEWWDDERDKNSKEYAALGPYAIRNIAKVAWEEGYKEGVLTKPEIKLDTGGKQ